ncbi:MAG: biotin--[acetyl-CoA-carboxylase] ligase [Bacillota bacterium]
MEKVIIGQELLRFDVVTSTNDVAKQCAAAGCVEGLVVIADQQTAGRGQNANQWHSAAGKGLYFSVVIRPQCRPENIKLFSLLAGVALNSSLRSVCGVESLIKWPNDIYCNSQKLAGVLCEAVWQGESTECVVIGIGVNITHNRNDYSCDLIDSATSLKLLGCAKLDKEIILSGILKQLDIWYQLTAQFGFAAIATLYNAQKTATSQPFFLEA